MKPDKATLYDLYHIQNLSTHAIAKCHNTSHTQVLRWMASYGLERRPTGRGLLNRGVTEPTCDELNDMIHVRHIGYEGVAALYGVDQSAVRHWLIKHNIPRPTIWGTRYKGNLPVLPNKEEAIALHAQGMSMREIGRMCGVTDNVIGRLFDEYGIQPNPDGWDGGKRLVCQDGHLVRSTYEQRVDDWLYRHDIEHVYEPVLPFDRRYRSDFLANGLYVEIWGVKGNAAYYERRERKRALYKAYDIPLVELTYSHFRVPRRSKWSRILAAHFIT